MTCLKDKLDLTTRSPAVEPLTSRELIDLTREILRGLGNDSATIAQRLRVLGCTGKQRDNFDGPLAKYLNDRLEEHPFIFALNELTVDERIKISAHVYEFMPVCINIPTPRACREFIRDFDGRYPDLIDDNN